MTSRAVTVPVALAALCVFTGVASAAILIHTSVPSTLATSTASAPFALAAGAQAADATHVTSFTLGANGTTFAATLRGVPHASITLPQLATLTSRSAASQTMTLSATTVASYVVTSFRFDAVAGNATLASLDLRASTPSASFELGPGQTVGLRARLGLAEGAGQHNVQVPASLRVSSSG